jgi:hypothetical protein
MDIVPNDSLYDIMYILLPIQKPVVWNYKDPGKTKGAATYTTQVHIVWYIYD